MCDCVTWTVIQKFISKLTKILSSLKNLVKPIFRNFKSLWLCSQLELERKEGQNVLHTVIHTIAIHVLN